MFKSLGAADTTVSQSDVPTAQSALRAEAERAGAVDATVADMFGDLVDAVESQKMTKEAAVLEMRKRKPHLFRAYNEMDDHDFANADRSLRSALRARPGSTDNEWRDLRADELSAYELRELEKALAGHVNRFDRAALEGARRRQNGEQK
ncbi:MAG TPA: hypothetical protein VGZ02_12485 [Candidatus Baltobacteraceae bacterium]|jgi:hypothetical protein|nr:hypothetical protein [Candidatus Baltobacteraceae bacterium]